jgi:hypothetical protein
MRNMRMYYVVVDFVNICLIYAKPKHLFLVEPK